VSHGPTGALERLASATGTHFLALDAARGRTDERLIELRAAFEGLERDEDVAVVLMGSWGRRELTSESDNDFVVLVDAPQEFRRSVVPTLDVVRVVLRKHGREPGREGVFDTYVYTDHLAGRIGLDRDDNANLTRRVLLLLESVSVAGDETWKEARRTVLGGYLEQPLRDRRPPRLLLNDVVRYWRTICVDFAGKQRERRGEGWGIRNAKLRLTRKALFAAGLLPILRCHEHLATGITAFLDEQFAARPVDRLADAFLRYDQADAGARGLAAYDEFLAILDDPALRQELEQRPRDDLEASLLFRRVADLGERFQQGLLTLLFDSDDLAPLTRGYGLF